MTRIPQPRRRARPCLSGIASVCLLALSVAGCTSNVGRVEQSMNDFTARERGAWLAFYDASEEQCGAEKAFLAAGKADRKAEVLKMASCQQRLKKEMVEPYLTFPDLYKRRKERASTNLAAYKSGKIGFDKYIENNLQSVAQYEADGEERLQAIYGITLQQAAVQDQINQAALAGAFANAATQMNYQPRPTTQRVMCGDVGGGTIMCRSQ